MSCSQASGLRNYASLVCPLNATNLSFVATKVVANFSSIGPKFSSLFRLSFKRSTLMKKLVVAQTLMNYSFGFTSKRKRRESEKVSALHVAKPSFPGAKLRAFNTISIGNKHFLCASAKTSNHTQREVREACAFIPY